MISVCIIEDNEPFKQALVTYLQKEDDMAVVFTGSSLADLPKAVEATPDVVIMDITLGKESSIESIQFLKTALPSVEVIILTLFEEEEQIFNSLKAGAIGYLLKNDPPQKVREAVRCVYKGEGVMNGTIARKTLSYFQNPAKSNPKLNEYNLTKREREILLLLLDGLTYKEIAARCYLSVDTINSHIRNTYAKLNVRSRAEIMVLFR